MTCVMLLREHVPSSLCSCVSVDTSTCFVSMRWTLLELSRSEHTLLACRLLSISSPSKHSPLPCREDVVEVNARMVLVLVASLMVHAAARKPAAQPEPGGA